MQLSLLSCTMLPPPAHSLALSPPLAAIMSQQGKKYTISY